MMIVIFYERNSHQIYVVMFANLLENVVQIFAENQALD